MEPATKNRCERSLYRTVTAPKHHILEAIFAAFKKICSQSWENNNALLKKKLQRLYESVFTISVELFLRFVVEYHLHSQEKGGQKLSTDKSTQLRQTQCFHQGLRRFHILLTPQTDRESYNVN